MVISDPSLHNGEYVIANLTTDEFRAGKECELEVGDHPWITEKCFVSFGDARKVTRAEDAKITANMAARTIRKQFPMGGAVLQRIVTAAKQSKAIEPGLLVYL